MSKNRKIISIEEVENGFVMIYTIAGSGQQKRTVFLTVDGVKLQVASWLDKNEEVEVDEAQGISDEDVRNAQADRITGAKY